MSKESNQRKHIPNSSPSGAIAFDENNRSALCHLTYREVGNAGFAGAKNLPL
jgi:hypothetical protein